MNLLEYDQLRLFEKKVEQIIDKDPTLEDLEQLYEELASILKQKVMLTYGN